MSFEKCKKWWDSSKHSEPTIGPMGKIAMPVSVFEAWQAGSLEVRKENEKLKEFAKDILVKYSHDSLCDLYGCVCGLNGIKRKHSEIIDSIGK